EFPAMMLLRRYTVPAFQMPAAAGVLEEVTKFPAMVLWTSVIRPPSLLLIAPPMPPLMPFTVFPESVLLMIHTVQLLPLSIAPPVQKLPLTVLPEIVLLMIFTVQLISLWMPPPALLLLLSPLAVLPESTLLERVRRAPTLL